MMQFGSAVKHLNDALEANPDWKWYPVHVSALTSYTDGLKTATVYLATHAYADGSVVGPESDADMQQEATELETPVVVIEIG